MRNIRLLLVGAAALVSAACWYESPVPLGPATQAIDTALFGSWLAPESEDSSRLLIFGFDERSYFMRYTDDSARGKPEDECCLYLHGHVTQVAGVSFMNARVIGEDTLKWMFFRFERNGETLRVRGLKEELEADSLHTTAKLNAYLAAHLNDPKIYDEWFTFKRVRGAPK